jgi:NAD(P)-dependent dehydrogenase (short-subunit alcohol dehydrogenase family)
MNPVALITGGSRGIGAGIARELAGLGWDLVLNYARHETAARVTAADCAAAARRTGSNLRVAICQADISLAADRQRLVDFARSEFGRLDLLVNNAGVAPEVRSDLLDAGEASFDRLMAVNAKGPFFLTQLVARWMIEQTEQNSPGSLASPPEEHAEQRGECRHYRPKIVTISSISADTASVNRGDYCVSKAALAMLTPLFAARLAGHGINVYEIRPGIVATDMTAAAAEKYDAIIAGGLTPIRRWGAPADVGKAVAAIAQDWLPFSTGEVIHVDGGFHLRTL